MGIKAMVLLEPGGTGTNYSDEQVNELVTIPLRPSEKDTRIKKARVIT
jgi:hypothetical protein